MQTLFKNIQQLVSIQNPILPLRGKDLHTIPTIENAYVIVEDGCIKAFGKQTDVNLSDVVFDDVVDCKGGMILPTWCDSHTHIVFASSRENEFIQKLQGKTYAEIAANGGGILNSAKKLQETTEDDLYDLAWERLQELIALGTGAIEIKSGYGLTTDAELKMLRVIKRLKKNAPIPVKATFLGAHTIPLDFKDNAQGYIDVIIKEMLPAIAKEDLADYVDVFCETGFFNPTQMEEIVIAAKQYGLLPKLHVNQLNSIGGLQKAIALNAISVDHLETMTDEDCKALANANVIGTLLPTAAYFLRMPFQPARKLIDAGAAIALASDYNPGSSPSGNMNTVVSMSCIQMKMLPEEAINAATINGAFAMQLQNELGSFAVGKKANFIVTRVIPSIAYIPYAFGTNLIDAVYINGKKFNKE